MKKITVYILRDLLIGTVILTGVLTYILWLAQSLGFIELIIKKGLSIGTWLELTVLILPNVLAIILPIALFVVIVFVYNKMKNDRELVIAQAVGISKWGLALPGILVAIIATIASYVITLYLGPASVQAFKELQWTVKSDVSQVLLREGSFNQIGKGITVYIKERLPNGVLNDILVHDKRDRLKSITLMAKSGIIKSTATGPIVMLSDGNRQELTRGSGDLSIMYFDNYSINLGEIQMTGDARFTDNRERSTKELFSLNRSDGLSEHNIRRLRVEGHQRLSTPLLNITFALIALSSALSSTLEKRDQFKRSGGAIMCIVFIEAATLGLASLASKNLLLVPLLYLVIVIPAVICLFTFSANISSSLMHQSRRVQLKLLS
jgi:lipopolysaccharide export system permease protein